MYMYESGHTAGRQTACQLQSVGRWPLIGAWTAFARRARLGLQMYIYSHCRYNSIAEKKLRLFTSREYSLDDWMSLAVLALAARPDKEWLMSYCVQRNSHEKKIMRPPLYTILLL